MFRSPDLPLQGTLILASLAIPYSVEVFFQVWLQARFLAVLPESVRARLPRHPRRPWLAFLAPLRFQIALLRVALRDLTDDSLEVRAWKRRVRASVWRELFLVSSLILVTIVLLSMGWRPIWP